MSTPYDYIADVLANSSVDYTIPDQDNTTVIIPLTTQQAQTVRQAMSFWYGVNLSSGSVEVDVGLLGKELAQRIIDDIARAIQNAGDILMVDDSVIRDEDAPWN